MTEEDKRTEGADVPDEPVADAAEAQGAAAASDAAAIAGAAAASGAPTEPAPAAAPTPRIRKKTRPLALARNSRRLIACSAGLMAACGVAYCLSVPGLISAMEARLAAADGSGEPASLVGSIAESLGSVVADAATAAGDALYAGTTSAATGGAATTRGGSALAGMSGLALSSSAASSSAVVSTDAAASTGAATTDAATSPSTATTPDSPATPDTPATPDEPETTNPEDEAFHATLLSKLNELDSYVAQVNSAVATFSANAGTASLADRSAYYEQCDALTWQVLSFEYSIVNTKAPSGSAWAQARENLIAASNRLYRYIAQFDGAWEQNIQYEDPSAHVDDWMGPVNDSATSAALSEFNAYYGAIAL